MNTSYQDDSDRNASADLQLQPAQDSSDTSGDAAQVAEEDSNGFVLGYN